MTAPVALFVTPSAHVRAHHFSVELANPPDCTIDFYVHHFEGVAPDDAYVTARGCSGSVVFDVSVDNGDAEQTHAIEALRAERFDEFALYLMKRLDEFIRATPASLSPLDAA